MFCSLANVVLKTKDINRKLMSEKYAPNVFVSVGKSPCLLHQSRTDV